MRWARSLAVALAITGAAAACKGRGKDKSAAKPTAGPIDAGARAMPRPAAAAVVTPPIPVAQPPADAESVTGVPEAPAAVVKLVRLARGNGPKPGRNDLVSINLDGWRLDGTTFLSTRTRHRPIQQSLAMLAPGFAVAVTTMQKGERAMVWVPPEVGYLGAPQGAPETLVYQVELVDFEVAPATPLDVAAIPAAAQRSTSGLASVVLERGTGKVSPRDYDGVTYHYSGWSSTGRMFDSSELRKRSKSGPMYREWPGVAEALAAMVVGERKRIWLPRDGARDAKTALVEDLPMLPEGTLCMELELLAIVPGKPLPPAPPDVGAAPPEALTTAGGVRYRVLTPGSGTVHPGDTDLVEVEYTGWTAAGRPFDSTVILGKPIKLMVSRALPGWTEAIKTMVAGQTSRFWIPQALAFKGEPGTPQGTVVFDLKLVRMVAPGELPAGKAQPPQLFGNPPPPTPPTPAPPPTAPTTP